MGTFCARFGGKWGSLPDKPEETVEATVRALWLRAAGLRVSAVKAMDTLLPSLNAEQLEDLEELMEQRVLGIPLAHLTGRQSFMGLEFICTKDALIPRKETEILARAACELLESEISARKARPRVLDLCCGSGNIACAIAHRIPTCQVFAADLSTEAVELAKENARVLGVVERLEFHTGDLFAPFELEEYSGSFDLIACNPPYISNGKLALLPAEIARHEPRLAFDGGPLGLAVLWKLLEQAPRFLKPDGWLVFEAGLGQGPGLLRRLSKSVAYRDVKGVCDGEGNPRVILARVAA